MGRITVRTADGSRAATASTEAWVASIIAAMPDHMRARVMDKATSLDDLIGRILNTLPEREQQKIVDLIAKAVLEGPIVGRGRVEGGIIEAPDSMPLPQKALRHYRIKADPIRVGAQVHALAGRANVRKVGPR